MLAGLGYAEAWLATDLSLGGWIGHQAARELLSQLARPEELETSRLFATAKIDRIAKSDDLIGRLVDAESRGNTAILTALELAERTAGALDQRERPFAVVVLAPRWRLPWRSENLAFLGFLAQALADGSNRLLIVSSPGEEPVLPAWWRIAALTATVDLGDETVAPTPVPGLLAWIPGLVDSEWLGAFGPDIADALGTMRKLPGGLLLVPPEQRCQPTSRHRTVFDRLAANAALPLVRSSFRSRDVSIR